jgi:hypothetical protein
LDQDGHHDLLAVQAFATARSARLLYFRNLGRGQFSTPGVLDLPGKIKIIDDLPEVAALGITDLNQDGNPDVVVSSVQPADDQPEHVMVLTNWWVPDSGVTRIGVAATGSGGHRPRIGVLGHAPRIGNQDFAVTVTDALGGTWGSLWIGTERRHFNVAGELDFYLVPRVATLHATRGRGPGGGYAIAPIPIPDDPGLDKLTVLFQWALADLGPGRAMAVTTSDAVEVMVGSRR